MDRTANLAVNRTRRFMSTNLASVAPARQLPHSLAVMADAHTHSFADADWPFADPMNVAALTTVHVLEEAVPILMVAHDADDGMWQILCGTTNDPKDGRIVCSGCMFEHDPTIGQLAELPLDWRAYREGPNRPWHREPRPKDEDDE